MKTLTLIAEAGIESKIQYTEGDPRWSQVESIDDPLLRDESQLKAETLIPIFTPKTTADVSAFFKGLEKNQKVIFSGARTGLVGGAVSILPKETEGILLSFSKMKEVLSSDAEIAQGRIRVQPGLSLRELAEVLQTKAPEWWFPVDPTEQSASVGGCVMNSSGGSRSYSFGSFRKWVQSLKGVLPSGNTFSFSREDEKLSFPLECEMTDGSEVRSESLIPIPKPKSKNALGYGCEEGSQPIDLIIGSEGTLAAITEIELLLTKRPAFIGSALLFFDSLKDALETVTEIKILPLDRILAIEFLDREALSLIQQHPSAQAFSEALMDSFCALIVEYAGTENENMFDVVETLSESVPALLNEKSLIATDSKQLAQIKSFRHAVPETVNALISAAKKKNSEVHKLSTDMSVCEGDIEWVYELYSSTLKKENFRHTIFGHIGNNHFHVNIIPSGERDGEMKRAKELYAFFAKEIVQRGGSVSGEHGLGRIKKEFLKFQFSSEVIENMWRVKNLFDPKNVLNPGVLLVDI